MDVLEKILEDEELKKTLDQIKGYNKYNEEESLTILLSLAFMQNGDRRASDLLKPLYEDDRFKNDPELSYWYSSSILASAESLEDYILAKGIMLDALTFGLKELMEKDALNKISYAEEKITSLLTDDKEE